MSLCFQNVTAHYLQGCTQSRSCLKALLHLRAFYLATIATIATHAHTPINMMDRRKREGCVYWRCTRSIEMLIALAEDNQSLEPIVDIIIIVHTLYITV